VDPPVSETTCWRCGGAFASTESVCPRCGAPFFQQTERSDIQRPPDLSASLPVTRLLIAYGLLLGTSVVQGMTDSRSFLDPTAPDAHDVWRRIAIFEAFDTLLVFWAWWWLPRVELAEPVSSKRRLTGWLLALPMLAAAVAINYGYHAVIRSVTHSPLTHDVIDSSPELWQYWLLVICIQPALIEELFFRGLAYRTLLPLFQTHLTVLVTAVMFGLAHIHAPLSMPVLMMLGVVLGYARAMTGSLWLPIVLHFLHNLVVTGMGWYSWMNPPA
ncbi:MAG TPA: CPBP family glutamic-type intramembrane protease, partial [Pirellulales bacterium]|nr:CPBP family glutamic-type intramembrane protease [Pirellulales bacterium]